MASQPYPFFHVLSCPGLCLPAPTLLPQTGGSIPGFLGVHVQDRGGSVCWVSLSARSPQSAQRKPWNVGQLLVLL